jgi:hypothetical protein
MRWMRSPIRQLTFPTPLREPGHSARFLGGWPLGLDVEKSVGLGVDLGLVD